MTAAGQFVALPLLSANRPKPPVGIQVLAAGLPVAQIKREAGASQDPTMIRVRIALL
ncbi:hypothetical protein ABIE62_001636 [Porphyrobacter sp. MBR-155]